MMCAEGHRGVCAILPMKGFGKAKSRLSALLDDMQRNMLAQAMFLDVLEVLLRAEGVACVHVVTEDWGVAKVASTVGATVIADEAETGTNEAVRQGIRAAIPDGWAAVLVVPADIPFLSVAEVEAALVALRRNPVVIAPAAHDGGTNLLGLAPPLIIPTHFGPDSFGRHVAAARAAGIEPARLRLAGAGHDIDGPSDLWLRPGDGPAVHTRRLLKQLQFFDESGLPNIKRKTMSP
jgi:2-phospho-L-lactate/phosphoenolpyruvate guanylyltransferase